MDCTHLRVEFVKLSETSLDGPCRKGRSDLDLIVLHEVQQDQQQGQKKREEGKGIADGKLLSTVAVGGECCSV